MPLKCLTGNQLASSEIFAFDFEDEADWQALRTENARERMLSMACCGAQVSLRTSKLGTRHFTHKRRGECTTSPESAEHLLAKLHIVRAIQQTSWKASAECSGTTNTGQAWRADVLATKGAAQVAFEVQMSRQTDEVTAERQQRYRNARVRGLWLMRQIDFPSTRDIPAFHLHYDADQGGFVVHIPREGRGLYRGSIKDTHYWLQAVALHEFIQGVLQRRLVFAPGLHAPEGVPVDVLCAHNKCWKCKRQTKVVTGLEFFVSRVFAGANDFYVPFSQLADVPEAGPQALAELLPVSITRPNGIGDIKPRYSRTRQAAYTSNGCVHCGALQGSFFEDDLAQDAHPAFTVLARLDERWLLQVPFRGSSPLHWWFDLQDAPPSPSPSNA